MNPLELELQEAATHLMRVLGTKLEVLIATEPSHQLLTFLRIFEDLKAIIL